MKNKLGMNIPFPNYLLDLLNVVNGDVIQNQDRIGGREGLHYVHEISYELEEDGPVIRVIEYPHIYAPVKGHSRKYCKTVKCNSQ
jgi:hypothetical protein